MEADERFPQELADEIRQRAGNEPGIAGYWMPFKNYVFGRLMRSDFWFFRKIKLYRKDNGSWQDRRVHTQFVLEGQAGELHNFVEHFPYPDLKIFLMKLNRYTRLEALELRRIGYCLDLLDLLKAVGWIPLIFWKHYVTWKGYRDGVTGLALAVLTSPYNLLVKLKYLFGRKDA